MGEEPEAIERQIDDTRGRIGARAEALAGKVNVPSRFGSAVAEKRDVISGGVQRAVFGAAGAIPGGEEVRRRARQGAGTLRDNPLVLALGAAAAGLLLGLLIPPTSIEEEMRHAPGQGSRGR